jgi:hypothetical protein
MKTSKRFLTPQERLAAIEIIKKFNFTANAKDRLLSLLDEPNESACLAGFIDLNDGSLPLAIGEWYGNVSTFIYVEPA